MSKIGLPVSKENLDLASAARIDSWTPSIFSRTSYKEGNTFIFLNKSHTFYDKLDWDFNKFGLLWTYNLNYFEFLDQPDLKIRTGLLLIDDFLEQYPKIKVAHEPYPISLRLVFWIRFFIRKNYHPAEKYLKAIHSQAKELQRKLEYHLQGNHLLENAFALFFTGSYLNDKTIIKQSECLLENQLNEQILNDGGHFELSPMYHQLMFYRLLDCINMARAAPAEETKSIITFLEGKASIMQGWMKQMSFSNGNFPLFNDSTYGIAPDPKELATYAKRLNIPTDNKQLSDSGYRKWVGDNWEIIIDIGRPGPPYQPGHAHCDCLSFVLQINDRPILVDTGISVYGGNIERRMIEKGTSSHNTVQIDRLEQSVIWGEFRMGKRAKIEVLRDHFDEIEAVLSGFYPKESRHIRKFKKLDRSLKITDIIPERRDVKAKAFLHFHYSVDFEIENNTLNFKEGKITFEGCDCISKIPYNMAIEYGKLVPSFKAEISFSNTFNTVIEFKN